MFSFYSNDKSARLLSPRLKAKSNRDHHVMIAGSCSGIVCYYNYSSAVFLCNPATREFKQLPMTDLKFEHVGVAFGFDSQNIYDFKVLRILCVIGEDRHLHSTYKEIRAEMFTLSSNSWKHIHCGLNDKFLFRGIGLYCCDIGTERFKLIEFPRKPEEEDAYFQFIMSHKGLLTAVYSHRWGYCEVNPIEVWVMQDYGVEESWTKFYSIGPLAAVPVCFWMDDHGLLLLQLKAKKLISFRISTLEFENIELDEYKDYSPAAIYKETLVSIM